MPMAKEIATEYHKKEVETMNKEWKNGERKESVPPEKPCCGSCAYFIRHSVFQWKNRGAQYIPCDCGHCLLRKLRRCLTLNAAPCEKYKRQLQPIRFHVKQRKRPVPEKNAAKIPFPEVLL